MPTSLHPVIHIEQQTNLKTFRLNNQCKWWILLQLLILLLGCFFGLLNWLKVHFHWPLRPTPSPVFELFRVYLIFLFFWCFVYRHEWRCSSQLHPNCGVSSSCNLRPQRVQQDVLMHQVVNRILQNPAPTGNIGEGCSGQPKQNYSLGGRTANNTKTVRCEVAWCWR